MTLVWQNRILSVLSMGDARIFVQFDDLLASKGEDARERGRFVGLLELWGRTGRWFMTRCLSKIRRSSRWILDCDFESPTSLPKADKRRRTEDTRTEALGSDPKEKRAQIRSELEEGFYTCLSSNKSIRIVHQMGSRFMLRLTYNGRGMPSSHHRLKKRVTIK